MPFFLTNSELSDYQAKGFLIRERVFSATELSQFRSAAQNAQKDALELIQQGAVQGREIQPYVLDGNRFADIDFITGS